MKKRLLAAMIAAAIALSGLGVAPAQAKTADTGTVKITVLAKDGTPLPGVDVEFGRWDEGTTNANGVYKTREFRPGTYRVGVGGNDWKWQYKSVTVTANEDSAATITVKGGVIVATLTAPKKIVKAGLAHATLYNAKGNSMGDVDIWEDSERTTTVAIGRLPAGTYTVVMQGANTTKKVTVKKDKATKVKLTRPAGYTISGTVTKPNGKPYAKQWVEIYDANETLLGSAETDAKGKYKVPGAVKGKYKVLIPVDSPCPTGSYIGAKVAKTVKIKGAKATVNLKVPKPTKVTGKVVNSKGKPVVAADVWLTGSDSNCTWIQSDGTYTLEVYRSGTYRVEAYADGDRTGKTAKKKVTLGKTVTFPTITVK